MSEILAYSIAGNIHTNLPQTMSDEWNDEWFTADSTKYATLLANVSGEPVAQETPSTRMSAAHVRGEPPVRYQYQYAQPFGGPQTSRLPMRAGGSVDAIEYSAGQQVSQNRPPSIHSSPRFPPSMSNNGAQMSIDSSTSATTAFPTILPSQKLRNKPASSSISTYAPLQVKRGPPDADNEDARRSPKRRPSGIAGLLPAQPSTDNSRQLLDLSEEERLLVLLKQDQNLPWKEIAKEFETRFGRPFQVPALQMRYKRLRERLRPWTNEDITALEAAHDYWENNKFEIIANKMLDFGVQDRWPARSCERKWDQLHQETSKSDTGTITAERAKSQQSLPARFDGDMENYSMEWPLPSPPRAAATSQATSPLSELAITQSRTIPTNPLLQNHSINQRTRYEPI